MQIINSVLLETKKDYQMVFEKLSELYNNSQVELVGLPTSLLPDYYLYVKSHRSNVNEGNTTTIGEFTNLVIERKRRNFTYVVPNKNYDETYEIDNLKKGYE